MKVPGSDWYNYIGTKKYVPGIVASNFDEVVEDSDTEKQVEANIEMYRKTHTSLDEPVNHPSHYNHGGRETIDIIKDHLNDSDWNAYQGGLLFNVYKYIDRAPYKGKRLEDLKKAAWYLNKLIEEVGEYEN